MTSERRLAALARYSRRMRSLKQSGASTASNHRRCRMGVDLEALEKMARSDGLSPSTAQKLTAEVQALRDENAGLIERLADCRGAVDKRLEEVVQEREILRARV